MLFTCKKCGKIIDVQPQVRKAYAGQVLCLACRNTHKGEDLNGKKYQHED